MLTALLLLLPALCCLGACGGGRTYPGPEHPKTARSWVEIRDQQVVRQHYDYSCGAASLATILHHYYGETVAEKDVVEFWLQQRAQEQREAEPMMSFSDLQQYAATLGYRAAGLALSLDSLAQLRRPAILYLEVRGRGHFTVYRGLDQRFVHLADPSFGNQRLKVERFQQLFHTRPDPKLPGRALVLLPPQDAPPDPAHRADFMQLTPFPAAYQTLYHRAWGAPTPLVRNW
ncbi:C39 family peptidase [Desulfurivibrio alkaliphilus]|uniref:C39 family peptidase n=1 Tax=Desulfurivibrio alkaliphilus TaxID=427923 RepID=UPI00067697F7|nr:cysteine peptidase family C39 domain-containing protein [Desulfurivibrio alkaliphilus]